MVQSSANTVQEYLHKLPEDRKETVEAVRCCILKNLPEGFEEQMQYGMIGYVVPLSLYPQGYHCKKNEPLPFAGLASQKNHVSFYSMCCYSNAELQQWLHNEFAKANKKLNMGKSCIRFTTLNDIPLEVIVELIGKMSVQEYIQQYEEAIRNSRKSCC